MSGRHERFNLKTIVEVCPEELAHFRRWGVSAKEIRTLRDLMDARRKVKYVMKKAIKTVRICGIRV